MSDNAYDYQLCITNTSLMATFAIYHSDEFSYIYVFALLSVKANSQQDYPFLYECDAAMDNDTLKVLCKK